MPISTLAPDDRVQTEEEVSGSNSSQLLLGPFRFVGTASTASRPAELVVDASPLSETDETEEGSRAGARAGEVVEPLLSELPRERGFGGGLMTIESSASKKLRVLLRPLMLPGLVIPPPPSPDHPPSLHPPPLPLDPPNSFNGGSLISSKTLLVLPFPLPCRPKLPPYDKSLSRSKLDLDPPALPPKKPQSRPAPGEGKGVMLRST